MSDQLERANLWKIKLRVKPCAGSDHERTAFFLAKNAEDAMQASLKRSTYLGDKEVGFDSIQRISFRDDKMSHEKAEEVIFFDPAQFLDPKV